MHFAGNDQNELGILADGTLVWPEPIADAGKRNQGQPVLVSSLDRVLVQVLGCLACWVILECLGQVWHLLAEPAVGLVASPLLALGLVLASLLLASGFGVDWGVIVLDDHSLLKLVLELLWVCHELVQLVERALAGQPDRPVDTGPGQSGLGLVEFLVLVGFFAGGSGITANRWPKRPALPLGLAFGHPLWIIHPREMLVDGSLDFRIVIRAELVGQDNLAVPFRFQGQAQSGSQVAGPDLMAIQPLVVEPLFDLEENTSQRLLGRGCAGVLNETESGALALGGSGAGGGTGAEWPKAMDSDLLALDEVQIRWFSGNQRLEKAQGFGESPLEAGFRRW